MRRLHLPVITLLALVLVTGGCGDDEAGLDAGANGAAAGDDTEVSLPDAPPDLVGSVTSVAPFVPVTEDCTPAEDLDPDGVVSSDDPPICTSADNDVVGTVLVEEEEGVQEGRKISYTVTESTVITGTAADGSEVRSFDDLAEGQRVDTWVAGDVCAESYPEQCGAEAIRVTG